MWAIQEFIFLCGDFGVFWCEKRGIWHVLSALQLSGACLSFNNFLSHFCSRSLYFRRVTKSSLFQFYGSTFKDSFQTFYFNKPRLYLLRWILGGCEGDLSIALFAFCFLREIRSKRKENCEQSCEFTKSLVFF